MAIENVGPWISAAKDIVFGGSAAFTAYFAYRGLSAWREELKGRAEYQLAKDILKAVYRVREGFRHVRNPGMFAYEFPEDLQEESARLDPENRQRAIGYAYKKRFEVLDESFKELKDLSLEAEVEWGPELNEATEKIRACRGELLTTIHRYVWAELNPKAEVLNKTEEGDRRRNAVLYEQDGEGDQDFSEEIADAVAEFESRLRPHVEKGQNHPGPIRHLFGRSKPQ